MLCVALAYDPLKVSVVSADNLAHSVAEFQGLGDVVEDVAVVVIFHCEERIFDTLVTVPEGEKFPPALVKDTPVGVVYLTERECVGKAPNVTAASNPRPLVAYLQATALALEIVEPIPDCLNVVGKENLLAPMLIFEVVLRLFVCRLDV